MLPKRTSGHHTHPCINKKVQKDLDVKKWCTGRKVADYVRFTPVEFGNVPAVENHFYHFNLNPSNFIPGKEYAALQIVSNGFYTDKSEQKPTLCLDHWYRLKCLSTHANVSHTKLSVDWLTINDLKISDAIQLLLAVWDKYHRSLPELTYSEFIKAKLCVTDFLVVAKEIE